MESFSFLRTAPFTTAPLSLSRPKVPAVSLTKFPPFNKPLQLASSPSLPPSASKSPRGFGPAAAQKTTLNRRKKKTGSDQEEEEVEGEGVVEVERDVTIPEVVTNRMMRRMGLSVGIPLAVGLLFFPFFYYLKVVAKVDVPNWIPFIVSFLFFGTALVGVSYGIVSASWDPLREGSLLGWNEARRNWPVFWDSLRRGDGKK